MRIKYEVDEYLNGKVLFRCETETETRICLFA